MNNLLEQAAKAAFEAFGGAAVAGGKSWEQQSETLRESFRAEAQAVLDVAQGMPLREDAGTAAEAVGWQLGPAKQDAPNPSSEGEA